MSGTRPSRKDQPSSASKRGHTTKGLVSNNYTIRANRAAAVAFDMAFTGPIKI